MPAFIRVRRRLVGLRLAAQAPGPGSGEAGVLVILLDRPEIGSRTNAGGCAQEL